MSDIKVNGNTYNGVTSVKLMKADGSGYAEYKEGAESADNLMDKLIARESLGDVERDDATPSLEWMTGYTFGNVSFPYATALKGGCNKITAENLLLPNVATVTPTAAGNNSWADYGFNYCKITGTLDLSSLATVQNNAVAFMSSNIGTLKLGSYFPPNNIWASSVITNAVLAGITDGCYLPYFASATITNLYVPASAKDYIQSKIDDGTLTKITNLYSIDDWED